MHFTWIAINSRDVPVFSKACSVLAPQLTTDKLLINTKRSVTFGGSRRTRPEGSAEMLVGGRAEGGCGGGGDVGNHHDALPSARGARLGAGLHQLRCAS